MEDLFQFAKDHYCKPPAAPPPTVCSSPSVSSVPDLPPEFAQIWAVLELHRGAKSAITAPVIAQAAGLFQEMAQANAGTKVRKILELTQDYWPWPLCADAAGYYLAETAAELTHYCANLRGRAICDFRRAKTTRRHGRRVGFIYLGHGRWADPETKGGQPIALPN